MKQLLEEIAASDSHGFADDLDAPWALISSIRAGDRVGPYRVNAPLGTGGMGVVFSASDTRTSGRAALKLPKASNECAVRRFRREFDLIRRLDDPGIVRVLDFGVAEVRRGGDQNLGQTAYFAMELVADAWTLTDWADLHASTTDERARLIAEVARIVQTAHGRGVHHLDLKPSNILVSSDGKPRIIDFGVARATELGVTETTMTGPGQQLGTLAYMAPEQAAGGRAAASAVSDVYSLGTLLYELLTGHPPHDFDGMDYREMLHTINQVPPARPRSRNPSVSRGLDAIVMKSLAPTPGARYPTADALRTDLLALLEGDTVSAIASERRSRAIRWIRRHTLLWTTAVSITVFIATLLTSWLWVQWYVLQPNRVAFDQATSTGKLLSRSGLVLHTYEGLTHDKHTQRGSQIVLLTPGQTTSTRQILVLHKSSADQVMQLRLYNIDAPGAPIWESDERMATSTIPPYNEADERAGAASRAFTVADVFAEHPGHEIIVAEQNWRNFPTRIRVYGRTSAGETPDEVLYETWNAGFINKLLWDPDRRRIIAAAFNNRPDRSALPGSDPHARNVVTVLAIDPVLGERRTGFLTRDADATNDVAWYLALPAVPGGYTTSPRSIHFPTPDRDQLMFQVELSKAEEAATATRSWALDPATGRPDSKWVPHDAWHVQLDTWGLTMPRTWGPVATGVPFFQAKSSTDSSQDGETSDADR